MCVPYLCQYTMFFILLPYPLFPERNFIIVSCYRIQFGCGLSGKCLELFHFRTRTQSEDCLHGVSQVLLCMARLQSLDKWNVISLIVPTIRVLIYSSFPLSEINSPSNHALFSIAAFSRRSAGVEVANARTPATVNAVL